MKHYNVVEVNIILFENKRHKKKESGKLFTDDRVLIINAITIDILVRAIHFVERKCLHLVSCTRAIV